MNKIHNNLNIENLIKTECVNQFSTLQINVILEGLVANLDVSIYAKTEYNEDQMRELKEGLEENLDVSKYATPDFGRAEMYG